MTTLLTLCLICHVNAFVNVCMSTGAGTSHEERRVPGEDGVGFMRRAVSEKAERAEELRFEELHFVGCRCTVVVQLRGRRGRCNLGRQGGRVGGQRRDAALGCDGGAAVVATAVCAVRPVARV